MIDTIKFLIILLYNQKFVYFLNFCNNILNFNIRYLSNFWMEDPVFLKVLVVGDSGVGKTSLLNKYCYNRFDNSVKPTIGCDFTLKAFEDF